MMQHFSIDDARLARFEQESGAANEFLRGLTAENREKREQRHKIELRHASRLRFESGHHDMSAQDQAEVAKLSREITDLARAISEAEGRWRMLGNLSSRCAEYAKEVRGAALSSDAARARENALRRLTRALPKTDFAGMSTADLVEWAKEYDDDALAQIDEERKTGARA